ncbi:MAG: hypothetical protein P8J20_19805 [Novosphingobium sp.]|nr:hypothetical protein [Novosphingobium sp.]
MIVLDPTQPSDADSASAGLPLAPRLDTLEGKSIGLWSNQKLNASQLLEFIREELAKDYNFTIVPGIYDPGRLMDEHEWGDLLDCDAVILANGDCGACSTSGIANAIEMEKKGIPAVLVSTTPFTDAVITTTRMSNMPAIEWAIVDHPIGSLDETHLRQRAQHAASQIPAVMFGEDLRAAAE